MEKITVQTLVPLSAEDTWRLFTDPEHIVRWNSASADWHTPQAINNLMVGGSFCFRMESRDGSKGFDFSGVYTVVEPYRLIEYVMDGDDKRHVRIEFNPVESATRLVETFDPENENSIEMQRGGWQSILDNFARYAEQPTT